MDVKRDCLVNVRLSGEEKKILIRYANHIGLPLASMLRCAAIEAARIEKGIQQPNAAVSQSPQMAREEVEARAKDSAYRKAINQKPRSDRAWAIEWRRICAKPAKPAKPSGLDELLNGWKE